MSQSGTIVSCPVEEDDGDEDEETQGPPKKKRRRVLVDQVGCPQSGSTLALTSVQPCIWDAEDQAPRRVLKLPGHKRGY